MGGSGLTLVKLKRMRITLELRELTSLFLPQVWRVNLMVIDRGPRQVREQEDSEERQKHHKQV